MKIIRGAGFVAFIGLLYAAPLRAQELFARIGMGISTPISDFGSTSTLKGRPKAGVHASASAGIRLNAVELALTATQSIGRKMTATICEPGCSEREFDNSLMTLGIAAGFRAGASPVFLYAGAENRHYWSRAVCAGSCGADTSLRNMSDHAGPFIGASVSRGRLSWDTALFAGKVQLKGSDESAKIYSDLRTGVWVRF